MRLRRLTKYAIGAGGMLVLVMAILLATSWGSAVAAQISNVFVTNDASHPVPVHEQGTANVNVTNTAALPVSEHNATQLLFSGELDGPSGSTPELDVSGYREIRLGDSFIACAPGGTGSDALAVEALEGGIPYTVDFIRLCDGSLGGGLHSVYDVPGRTLRVRCLCDANTGLGLAIFGRNN